MAVTTPLPARGAPSPISARQLRIIAQLALGCSDQEAGRALGLGSHTIKRELTILRAATGTRARFGIVGWAYRAGLLARLYGDRAPVGLTKRRAQILDLTARGMRTADIARQQYVSDNTVRTLMRLIFNDLGARNRAQAVALGYEFGILDRMPPEAHAC